jgi:hypothetical protein
MAWRGKYIGWFRLLQSEYNDLVPPLKENEIMENVEPEDRLVIPEVEENKDKNPPHVFFKLTDEKVTIGVVYDSKKAVDHLMNVFKDTHIEEKKKLFALLSELDASYETQLYKEPRDSKPEILRSYVAARLDEELLKRIIDEANSLRRGGRQTVNNSSIYVPPQDPVISIVEVKTPLDKDSFIKAASDLKPIFKLLVDLKTQREIIREKLQKPKVTRNLYREFIEVLNEARSRGLLDAEEWRNLNKQWRENEADREQLLDEINERLRH